MRKTKKKIEKINKLLIRRFGVPLRQTVPPNPVDMLVATILSQNTNDKNSYKAFTSLKKKYKNWTEVAHLTKEEIEKEIRAAGLGKQKSATIKNFLNSLLEKRGVISLDYLTAESDEKIIRELTSYSGVGVKTASCVLLFALHRNICPVDTHVHRTVNRLGIVCASTPDKTFWLLKEIMPEKIAHQFHTNLIRLGREICKPAKPLCLVCPLLKACAFENKNMVEHASFKTNDFMLLDNVNLN